MGFHDGEVELKEQNVEHGSSVGREARQKVKGLGKLRGEVNLYHPLVYLLHMRLYRWR